MWKRLYRKWLEWKYRNYDHEVCCCGESEMGTGGSICHHGGCRSALEYAITCKVDRRFPNVFLP